MAEKLTMKLLDTKVKRVEITQEEFMDAVSADFVSIFELYEEQRKEIDSLAILASVSLGVSLGLLAVLFIALFA